MNTAYLASLVLIVMTAYVIRLVTILPFFHTQTSLKKDTKDEASILRIQKPSKKPLRIFVFLGSGGHTGEMIRLLENYKDLLLNESIVYLGYSDEASRQRFASFIKKFSRCKVQYSGFMKAREVKATFLQSVKTIVGTLVQSFVHVVRIRFAMCGSPHLFLLNGPGTCCIISFWLKIIELVVPLLGSSHIVYVESLARINTPSLTGKILYWVVDEFIVQWQELRDNCLPRSKWFGILV
ncbi:N-acetylglucosaminyldiphosphodolichol N-acetylglucosaminyltransferase anchoring subunit ALG14 [Saccharomyces paradoxus]|uniref:UDP-N-acetylglucosamine transferase subunit ALG14 n=1 Tax=Saccharomyces paradoxus TaxID=27291 RepID=A0A8B8ULZ8_SACPA|nr:Alg14 [Saccharomyces paradoxus]QHS71634.1 Alg14 [Saccharomyces paradoxus]